MRILVVDDEEEIRKVLFQGILSDGHECKTAENGLDAIGIISSFKPEVVITDYRMPNMNGIELMELIHRRFEGIQVIVLTGHAELEIAIDAVNLGAYAFFRKPLDLVEILTTLKELSGELKEEQNKTLQRQDWIKEHARLRAAHSALVDETRKTGRGDK